MFLGYAFTAPAAAQVLGVTPLSLSEVRRIKRKMWLQGNWSNLVVTTGLSGLMVGALVTCFFLPLFLCIPMLMAAAVVGIGLRNILHARSLWLNWAVADECSYGLIDMYGRFIILPERIKDTFNRARAAGLHPQVEYFDTDPFLFVEVKGERVYLHHWE